MLHAHGDRHHTTATYDTAADRAIAPLYHRARRLREHAPSLTPPLAEAYRRRAAELDLQVWLEPAWNPPIDRIGVPVRDPLNNRSRQNGMPIRRSVALA